MVEFSRPLILRQLAMCWMTSLCVSRTSVEEQGRTRGAVSHFINARKGYNSRSIPRVRIVSIPQTCGQRGAMERRVGLRPLLLGPALDDREMDRTLGGLGSHVEGLKNVIREVYGDSVAAIDAGQEMGQIAALGNGAHEVTCKRAALLYALYKEPEVQRYFEQQEAAVGSTYAKDMAKRVLPFVVPRFLKHSCQAPDDFVHMCIVLAEMWPDVRLGNFPLRE